MEVRAVNNWYIEEQICASQIIIKLKKLNIDKLLKYHDQPFFYSCTNWLFITQSLSCQWPTLEFHFSMHNKNKQHDLQSQNHLNTALGDNNKRRSRSSLAISSSKSFWQRRQTECRCLKSQIIWPTLSSSMKATTIKINILKIINQSNSYLLSISKRFKWKGKNNHNPVVPVLQV